MRVVHIKRGTVYETVGEGTVQCNRPMADNDKVMVYRDPYSGDIWVRPLAEFNDGRFRAAATATEREESWICNDSMCPICGGKRRIDT